MTQQLLDGADVRAPLQEMRRKAVPETVRADDLGQSHPARRHLDRLVDHRRVHVKPPHHAAARVGGHVSRREHRPSSGGAAAPRGPDGVILAILVDLP